MWSSCGLGEQGGVTLTSTMTTVAELTMEGGGGWVHGLRLSVGGGAGPTGLDSVVVVGGGAGSTGLDSVLGGGWVHGLRLSGGRGGGAGSTGLDSSVGGGD